MSDPVVEEQLEKGARPLFKFGLLAPNGNVHGPISNRVTAESAAFTNDRLVSRWVGPWVPVEEGTDG